MTAPAPPQILGALPTVVCACGHPSSWHDPIAVRYCRATVDGDLHRNCVCYPVSSTWSDNTRGRTGGAAT